MSTVGVSQFATLLAGVSLIGLGVLGLAGSLTIRPVLFAGVVIAIAVLAFFAGQSRQPLPHQQDRS